MKLQILYLAVCSLTTQAVYLSRMSTISRTRAPTAFRPGINLQRPWNHPRFVQAGSHRAPYVLYRSSPHRYISKPYNQQATRSVFTYSGNSGPWKTTSRFPLQSSTPEYEFVRSASAQQPLRIQANGGAIHTIPAPNLSLSEKPIVVLEGNENVQQPINNHVATDAPKQTYEVTEKHVDPIYYHNLMGVKTNEAAPVGFSKQGTISSQDLNELVRNSAALQIASDYGLQAFTLPQPAPLLQQPLVQQQTLVQPHQPINHQSLIHQQPLIQQQPQPITVQFQGFHGLHHNPQDLMRQGLEGIIIPPNALYQTDPTYLQKIQNQLLKRFPSIEFVPYNPDLQNQISTPSQILVLNENSANTQQPLSVIPIEQNDNHKTVIRETQESVVTLVPQVLNANVTENEVEVVSVVQPQNVTVEIVPRDSQSQTSTVKYVIETTTEDQKVTPIYYAQVGQSVGNVIANGFYSAINDVRAAAALAQVDVKKKEDNNKENVTSTTTVNPDVKTFFVQSEKNENNQTVNDLKSLLGVPFAKTDSVKVAYTLLRADDKEPHDGKDGTVYAGQIVQATITEDQDFNKEKADLLSKRPTLRLVPVPDITEPKPTVSNQQLISNQQTIAPAQKSTVVKAKIPPKSKLTFDDKTGEPILRIYASYVDSPLQKDMMTAKLTNMKHVKEIAPRKQESNVASWKAGEVKTLHSREHSSSDLNKVTQFGLKLRSRMDDIVPIFDEYDN